MGLVSWFRRRGRTIRRVFLWTLHVLLVTGVLVLLWYLNRAWRVEPALLSPFPRLHSFWLPLLFLLLYVFAWFGWWLYRLLGADRATGEFPDIDSAWEQGVAALKRAGIEPAEVPLILVLGRPGGALQDFFAAAQMSFAVRDVPRDDKAPVHVYANRQAIFVTCEGASLLGKHAALLAGAAEEGPYVPQPVGVPEGPEGLEEPPPEEAGEEGAGVGVSVSRPAMPVLPGLAPVSVQAAPGVSVTVAKKGGIGGLSPEGEAIEVQPVSLRPSVLKDPEEVAKQAARLKYLCRRIASARDPYCPVNGMLWLLPLACTDPTPEAGQTNLVCARDRVAAREALQVDCPSAVVLCDIERLPGVREMLRSVPEERPARQRLLGQTFPLVPDLNADLRAVMVQDGTRWISRMQMPRFVYQLFRLEPPFEGQRWDVTDENALLFRLLAELRERLELLGRAAGRGVGAGPGEAMCGGCYLAATGADDREQAYVGGVLRQLIAQQNYVAWTPEALDEEAGYRRLARLGYVGIVAFVLTLAVLGYWASGR